MSLSREKRVRAEKLVGQIYYCISIMPPKTTERFEFFQHVCFVNVLLNDYRKQDGKQFCHATLIITHNINYCDFMLFWQEKWCNRKINLYKLFLFKAGERICQTQ